MKTNYIDYILSSLVLTLMTAISVTLTSFFATSISITLFANYHFIVDIVLFLFLFGFLSAAICRGMVAAKLIRSGRFELGSPECASWKLFNVVYLFGQKFLSPLDIVFLRPLILKLYGFHVGRDVAIDGYLSDPQLITISDEVILGHGSVIAAHILTSGWLVLEPVVIGPRVTIGVNSVVQAGSTIGADSIVLSGSVVKPNTHIPEREMWGGIPAQKIKALN
jgi:hypothetical protein